MSISVTCPFCRSVFALAEMPAARRTPCPNCGESAPVSADAPAAATVAEAPPPAPAPRASGIVFISVGLTALIVAGFALWFTLNPKPPEYPPGPPPPPATTPPKALSGLKYIPKDSQLVVAVQPAVLDQFARGTGGTAEQLLGELGVPAEGFKQLRAAGLPPEAVHSLIVAVADVELLIPRLVVVLTLREPLKDEGKFRDKLNAQGRDPTKVELGGFPLLMAEASDRVFVFALSEKDLATAKAATGGYDDLHPGLRESVDRVNLAAVGWVATDTADWAGVPTLKLLGDRGPGDLTKRLAGVRAAAVGLSMEPTLYLRLSVRTNDSGVARDTAAAMQERLTELTPAVTTAGEWADAAVSLDPPGETLPKLKAALRK